MGFSTDLKTIMKLDDKDWKKTLESVKQIEKQYYKESRANSLSLQALEEKRNKQLSIQAASEAHSKKLLLAAEKSGSKEKIKLINDIQNKNKVANREILAGINKEISEIRRLNAVQKNQLSFVEVRRKHALGLQSATEKQIGSTKRLTAAEKNRKSSLESGTNAIVRHWRQLETLALMVYTVKTAWDKTIGSGIETLRMMESNTMGVAALVTANTRMTDSLGNTLTPLQKFQMGMSIAKDTMKQLRLESLKTPATFKEITEVYQQAIGQTLGAGDAFGESVKSINKNTIQLSKDFTNVAGSIGMEMPKVKEEIRSALTGNVNTDSIISTMIFGSPTQANEAVKKAKERTNGLAELFDLKFKPFRILEDQESFDKGLNQLKGAWEIAMADMVDKSGMFQDITSAFYDMAEDIKSDTEGIVKTFDSFYNTVKDIAPIVGRIGIGVGAIKIAAMVNPFTAWAVTLATVVGALVDITSEIQKTKQEARIKNLVTSTSGDITSTSSTEQAIKAREDVEGRMLGFSRATEKNVLEGNVKTINALADEWNRLSDIIDGTTQKQEENSKILETAKEQVELLTKLNFNESLHKELLKQSAREEDKRVTQTKLLAEIEKEIKLNREKLAKTKPTDTFSQEAIKKDYDALVKGKEEAEDRIAEIDKKREYDRAIAIQTTTKLQLEAQSKYATATGKEVEVEEIKHQLLSDQVASSFELWQLSIKNGLTEDEQNKAKIKYANSLIALNKEADERERQELADKIKLHEDYESTIASMAQKNDYEKLDGLAKEALQTFDHYDSLIEKYAEVAGAETALRELQAGAIDTIIAKQNELNEAYDNKTVIDSLDETYGRYEKLIDAQIELAENGMNIDFDFGDGAKELNNISKAMQQLHVGSLKYTKQDMKMQEDYAKAYLKAGDDTVKQAQLEADFDADNAALNKARQSAEIAGYANLAGAIAGAFEEGSGAAKAFQAIQATLGIVNAYTSISQAMALPFPANIPATASAIAAAMPLIGTLASLGGSGGGGSAEVPTTSTGFSFDQNREQIEGSYTPITDRLERQIELLESIDRQGSASQLGIELSATSFERDTKIWVEDVLEKGLQGGYDESFLREGRNLIKTLITMSEESLHPGYLYLQGAADAGYNWLNWLSFAKIEMEKDINEYQNLVSEWSLSVIDSMSDLKDAAKDFKGYYDDITGSMFYETQRLNEAFADVDRLRGTASFADYLKTSVDNIKALESFFTDDVFNLLMSNDTADIEAQIAAVEELGRATGQTFENGAKEALNYLESIELVAEAMAGSRENIKSFVDSFKTSEQLAQDMASTLGVTLATTGDELVALFNNLSGGIDGLTDSELKLLDANKALIDSGLDEYISSITSDIASLESVVSSLSSIIDKLKGAAIGSEYTMAKYYDSMSKTLSLSGSDDVESFQKSLNETISASNALFNAENFTTTRDQQFAQLVAANQFNTMEDTALEQIDYLKLIEENTREQINAILLVVEALGKKVDTALFPHESSVNSAYQSVLGREAESAGSTYWQNEISTGAIAASSIGIAVGTAAVANNEISRADYVTQLYTQGLGRTPTSVEVDYWANKSATSTADLPSLFSQLEPSFKSFYNGSPNMQDDMIAGYKKGEIVIPTTFSDGLRNGTLNMGSNEEQVALLRQQNGLLSGIITKLQEQLDTQNSSAESLEYIAKVS